MSNQLHLPLCWRLTAIVPVPPLYRFSVSAVLGVLLSLGLILRVSGAMADSLPMALALNEPGESVVRLAQSGRAALAPAGIDRLRQDLSRRTKLPAAAFKVVETTPKTWSDGCLGLRKPDEICTEALVEGWRVVLAHGKQRWDYHTDKQARLYRLATPAKRSGSAPKAL